MSFRYAIKRTVQIDQYQPLTIEVEMEYEKMDSASRDKVADTCNDFMEKQIRQEVARHKGLQKELKGR